ncbi:MAG: ATP-binding protein [Candidatus Cloacimonetes bacterium]|nr:ATP-binding protein [Candidatus Cloacimonadota bacterium]MCF7814551.1 ATP-binding protein [Candidatus Cloacimonadota bacterium]MCF7868837.1 ATP-binding protein [Candidatus Cloacimonadota bacterium]MCF7884223.1 ATP-binding protein [Candidatus Cloacimonadota bacterium]
MKRIQKEFMKNDLKKKMVFLVGPRQVGKTWLAKEISKDYEHPLYMNYDSIKDREIIREESWRPNVDLLIFDEIHKMPGWKNYLKGIYDNKPEDLHILVTGSARLDSFRQSGDSLTGRFFIHHLLPFSYQESLTDQKFSLDFLIGRGGFPEPLLAEDMEEVERWRTLYIDSLIREDILDFENIQKLKTMKTLITLLQNRVGAPLSYLSLAQDLDKSPHTIKKYIQILESLYIIFLITPYSRNIARSLKKEPKLYFFDTGMVIGDEGVIFENYLAVSLLKHCQHLLDTRGINARLQYIRTKEKKEVDFCLVEDDVPILLLEAKTSDESISNSLWYFHDKYKIPAAQVVRYLKKERLKNKIAIRKAESYLSELSI